MTDPAPAAPIGAAHAHLRPVRRRATRSCRPAWAGWSGARLTVGHRRGRRPRHPGLGHHDPRRAAHGHRRGQGPHRQALRRQPAHRPARHRRPHRPARSASGVQGGVVRPGARAATSWPSSRTPASSPCRPSAPSATPRRWPSGASTPSSPRAPRAAATPATVPTSLLLPQVVDAVDIPVLGAGGFSDGRGLVAALAWGASGIAMGTRFLLTEESTVPDAVKEIYLGTPVTGTVVTTAHRRRPPAGDPHRGGRRDREGVDRHPAAQGAAARRCEFRKHHRHVVPRPAAPRAWR